MPKEKNKIERRCVEFRLNKIENSNDDMKIAGVGAVFEKPTVLVEINGVEYKEVVDRHALDNADFKYCCLKYNHENSVPILARTRNGSLQTNIDENGLNFEAKLFNTSVARDIYTIVKEGGLDQCSFAFTVKKSEYDEKTHTRRILEIDKVFDISVVDVPAYEDTTVQARSFFELENKKNSLESEKRKKLKLKLCL